MKAGREIGELGTLLKQYRLAASLTQEELADRAQVSARSISDLERGLQRVPYPSTIRRLTDALQLTVDQRALFQAAAFGLSSEALGSDSDAAQRAWVVPSEPWQDPIHVPPAREAAPAPGIEQVGRQARRRRALTARIGLSLALVLVSGFGLYHFRQVGSAAPQRLNGPAVTNWGPAAFRAERLMQPQGVATDAQGRVYVADARADRIFRFSPSGSLLNAWGTKGSGPGQLRYPTAITVDHQGMVFVADTGNNRVQKFTAGGKWLTAWGSTGVLRGQFRRPDGIAVDAQGYIYVSDWENDRIQLLAPDGHVVAVFVTKGLPPAETPPYDLISPGALTIDAFGTVYVVDDSDGAFISFRHDSVWNMLDSAYSGTKDLKFPTAVAVDNRRHEFVTDTFTQQVLEFLPSGVLVGRWGSEGQGPGQFQRIGGVAIGRGGDVYVTDAARGRVERFTAKGRFVSQWGPQLGSAPSQPRAIAVDSRGNVYVADMPINHVVKLSVSGRLLATWGGSGSRAGQFDAPSGLALDTAGNVYVADANNDRIQTLWPSGKVRTVWGSPLQGLPPDVQGQLSRPAAVAVDTNGRVYVVDSLNDQLRVFTVGGTFLGAWTHLRFGSDSRIGELSAVAVDPQHNVYVGDVLQGTISVLSPSGTFLRQWRAANVRALAVDHRDRVYAANAVKGHVEVYSSTAVLLGSIAGPDSNPFTFRDPTAVAVAPDGAVYVGDGSRRHLYKFDPPS